MKKHLILVASVVFVLIILSVGFSFAQKSNWYFPMTRYQERIRVKDFGQYIDDSFYIGKENLFPFNKFYGYHAGVDLEVFPEEKDSLAPVYATGNGKIVFVGSLKGYGGVILELLDETNHTVLYGHVKILNIPIKNGQSVKAGDIITYLGGGFSSETSKERKHLHFGIHKGKGQYFKGHENTLENLRARWENPTTFLKNRNALFPEQDEANKNISPTPYIERVSNENNKGILYSIINWIKNLFRIGK